MKIIQNVVFLTFLQIFAANNSIETQNTRSMSLSKLLIKNHIKYAFFVVFENQKQPINTQEKDFVEEKLASFTKKHLQKDVIYDLIEKLAEQNDFDYDIIDQIFNGYADEKKYYLKMVFQTCLLLCNTEAKKKFFNKDNNTFSYLLNYIIDKDKIMVSNTTYLKFILRSKLKYAEEMMENICNLLIKYTYTTRQMQQNADIHIQQ